MSSRLRALLALIACASGAPVFALGMPDLLNMTFQGNPALQGQERLVQASQADIQGAAYQFFPTPSVAVENVSAASNDLNYNKDSRVTTLRLQQPIWTGGRLTAGFDRAQSAAATARAAMEDVRQQLALRTIQGWGEWKSAQQKALALQDSVLTHERLRDLIVRRVKGGLSASADEIMAQGRLEQARAEQNAYESQVAVALARLEQLTGRRLGSDELADFSVSPQDQVLARPDAVERAIRLSPLLQKLESQVKVQEHEIQVRKAQVYPEVYVRAEQQRGSFSSSGLSLANRFFIGMSASPGAGMSVFSGIDAAVARLESAVTDVESARRSVAEQVSIELASARSQKQRSVGLEASLNSAEAMVRSWDRQFLAGRKSWVEVMNAARELAQSQTALVDVRVAYVVSTWRLAVYSQGLESVLAGPGASMAPGPLAPRP